MPEPRFPQLIFTVTQVAKAGVYPRYYLMVDDNPADRKSCCRPVVVNVVWTTQRGIICWGTESKTYGLFPGERSTELTTAAKHGLDETHPNTL